MICIQHDRQSSQSSLQIQDVNYEKNKPRIYNGEENKERVSIFFFNLEQCLSLVQKKTG